MEMLQTMTREAYLIQSGLVKVALCLGFLFLFLSVHSARKLAGSNAQPDKWRTVIYGLVGGTLLFNINAVPLMVLGSIYGAGTNPDALLSTMPGSVTGAGADALKFAAFQVIAVIGWYYGISGLFKITYSAPRGEATMTEGIVQCVAGIIATAPSAYMAMMGATVNWGG